MHEFSTVLASFQQVQGLHEGGSAANLRKSQQRSSDKEEAKKQDTQSEIKR
jgi:hypothetical protein